MMSIRISAVYFICGGALQLSALSASVRVDHVKNVVGPSLTKPQSLWHVERIICVMIEVTFNVILNKHTTPSSDVAFMSKKPQHTPAFAGGQSFY